MFHPPVMFNETVAGFRGLLLGLTTSSKPWSQPGSKCESQLKISIIMIMTMLHPSNFEPDSLLDVCHWNRRYVKFIA